MKKERWLIGLFLFLFVSIVWGEDTIGLLYSDPTQVYGGYTLFAPLNYKKTYLIDTEGNLVHSWQNNCLPGQSVYLLEDGRLLRPGVYPNDIFIGGGAAGRIQVLDWNGVILWDFVYSDSTHRSHHDVEFLPNGNILFIAWELKTRVEAIQAGRVPNLVGNEGVWADAIFEVHPIGIHGGQIVWEWHSWDHLVQDVNPNLPNYGVVAEHPEKLNINYVPEPGQADWLHVNDVAYNADLDQIIVNSRNFSEFFIIDHSTVNYDDPVAGIVAAAGEAGDILYRWGNPQAYDRGNMYDQKLFGQHDTHWIPDSLPDGGKILLFNNGKDRVPPPNYSTVEIIVPDVDEYGNYIIPETGPIGPDSQEWIYTADPPTSLYSSFISGAQRLPNGNTIICEGGKGTFYEINPSGDVVWKYVNPVTEDGPQYQGTDVSNMNHVFRCRKYGYDYPAFAGHDLSPQGPIELYTNVNENVEMSKYKINIFPNPFNAECKILANGNYEIDVYNIHGEKVIGLIKVYNNEWIWKPSKHIASGIFFVKFKSVNNSLKFIKKVLYLK